MPLIMSDEAKVALLSFSVSAQQATFQDPMLDRLVGTWVLQGIWCNSFPTHA
jgi:hypothetical protein